MAHNTGRDVSVDIITPYGAIQLDPDMIDDFQPQPVTVNQKFKGLSGKPVHEVIPDGYRGSFSVRRVDSTLDDWWARFEADYYAGVKLPGSTITETITNVDGSVSQYRYLDVVIDVEDLGQRKADQPIVSKLNFQASRRIKVA